MTRVARTDADRIIQNHEDRIGALEQSGNDPQEWVYVGSGSPAPDFQNGFYNIGGSEVPMRYRFLRTVDPDLDPNALTPNGIELQGAVAGGSDGDTIFTLLAPGYLPDGTPQWTAVNRDKALHLATCDSAGDFLVMTVKTNGDVVYGFV